MQATEQRRLRQSAAIRRASWVGASSREYVGCAPPSGGLLPPCPPTQIRAQPKRRARRWNASARQKRPSPTRAPSRNPKPIRCAGQNRPGDLSRFIAQGLRSSKAPPKKVCLQNQNPLMMTSSSPAEGRLPMPSSEPAPSSPRPWASAWARPLADESTLNPAPPLHAVKRTFLLCWE